MQKKVTLSLDDEVYGDFQEFCEENDIMLSKRVERLMREHLGGKGKIKVKPLRGRSPSAVALHKEGKKK
mgnify:CR=1 FL=1